MEFIRFTFQSFWHFVGMLILLNGAAYFIVNGIIRITAILRLGKNITTIGDENNKDVEQVKKPIKSKWQQRLEDAAKKKGYNPENK